MRRVLAASLLLSAGCAPAVVWHGHSPDRRVPVAVHDDGQGQYVLVDGEPGEHHDGVSVASLTFSDDGRRIAYAAREGSSWFLVVDGRRGPAWDGIGTVAFTPDGSSVVHAALADDRWHVVVDHDPGPPFDALLAGSLALGPNGRVAYATSGTGGVRVIVDGEPSPLYDGVGALQFSPTGRHYAYVARTGDSVRLVVDGAPDSPVAAIAEVVWPPSAARPATLSRWDDAWNAVIRSDTIGPFTAVGSLTYRPDGRWAFVARSADGDRVISSVDRGPLHRRVLPGSLVGGAGRWAYVTRTDRGEQVVVRSAVRATRPIERGRLYDRVRELQFSPDGSRFGYIGAAAEEDQVVVEGRVIGAHSAVSDLAVGTRCGPTVYVVASPRGDSIFVDGRPTAYDRVVPGSLVLTEGGRHWGALASVGDRPLRFLVNGSPRGPPFDWSEFAAELGADREGPLPDQVRRILQRWTAAEVSLRVNDDPATIDGCGERTDPARIRKPPLPRGSVPAPSVRAPERRR